MDACPWPFLFLYNPAACSSVINYCMVQNLVRAEHKIITGTQNGWREVNRAHEVTGLWVLIALRRIHSPFSLVELCALLPQSWEVFTFINHFIIRFIGLDKKEPHKLHTLPCSWFPELPDLSCSKVCHELPSLCLFLCFVSILVLEQELRSLWKMIRVVILLPHFL